MTRALHRLDNGAYIYGTYYDLNEVASYLANHGVPFETVATEPYQIGGSPR